MPINYRESIRNQKAGSLFLLSVCSFVAFIIFTTLSWMFNEQRIPLAKLELSGDLDHLHVKDVQDVINELDSLGTFMSQDVDILQYMLSSLPWADKVSVRKQWPDTIKIHLVEHKPIAMWNDYILLNSYGTMFSGDANSLAHKLTRLYGPEDLSRETLQIYRKIRELLVPLDLQLVSFSVDERHAWQIKFANGVRVELGQEAQQDRLLRFIALYNALGSQAKKVAYVDLRYDTGAAVGWVSGRNKIRESKK